MVVTRHTSFGDVFGVFATYDAAILTMQRMGRSVNTHTIRKTAIGYIVTHRGY